MDIKFRVFFLSYLDFFFFLVRILSASAVLFRTFHSHDVSLPGKNEQKKTLEQYCFSSQSSCSLYTEPVAPVTPTSHMILSLSLSVCVCVRDADWGHIHLFIWEVAFSRHRLFFFFKKQKQNLYLKASVWNCFGRISYLHDKYEQCFVLMAWY